MVSTTAGAAAVTPSSPPTVNGQATAVYGDKTFATTAGLGLNNGANTFGTKRHFFTMRIWKITDTK
jgi:hypothetical protein